MQQKFPHQEIEKRWQEKWEKDGIYNVGERDASKEKEYVLVELPYPSGNLHIGHWFAFAVVDIYVRFRKMCGKQVIFPIGFDAFGLPAENAAIKRDTNPKDWTDSNIEHMRGQLQSMGNAFSWDKTATTTDPEYYRWTQWMFTKFFEKDIAYRGKGTVNWCPSCNTVLANEQVLSDETCERCGTEIEKRQMDEWKLRITDYADRLVDDLEKLDWPEHIKESQRNWIGRSKGAKITFRLSTGDSVDVFTTRPDTLYGATYMVLAPEHPLISTLDIGNREEVDAYVSAANKASEQDRLNAEREKTGVCLEGVKATNPATKEEIPVYIADYVLAGYGTGAIMAVPAHDERDAVFAEKFGLPVKSVVAIVSPNDIERKIDHERTGVYGLIKNEKNEYLLQYFKNRDFYWFPGGGIDKGETELECLCRELEEETGYRDFKVGARLPDILFDYIKRNEEGGRNHTVIYNISIDSNAKQHEIKMTDDEIEDGLELRWVSENELEEKLKEGDRARARLIHAAINWTDPVHTGAGVLINSGEFTGMDSEEAKEAITKHVGGELSNTYRLRDWSVGRQRYWGVPIPIVYDPDGKPHAIPEEHLPWLLPGDVDFRPTGEPPLAKSKELKERTEEIFGKGWTPEVETMDTFVDSSWYFLRYIDNQNSESPSSLDAQQEWMPVDIYFGGAEHTTMHLLYSRFWQKALFDLGLVTVDEPYTKRINRGLVLGPDGNKMSKSKGNVIDPDEQVSKLGADTVRMYLAFMGPYGEVADYPWDMGGIMGLRRFLERVYSLQPADSETEETTRLLHKTVKKVRADIQLYKFNTAISAMMTFLNHAEKEGISDETYQIFLRLLAPFAPHLTEELWYIAGNTTSIHLAPYPEHDEALVTDEEVTIGVQVNGKVRGNITLPPDASEEAALESAKADEKIAKWLGAGEAKKIVYIPARILNIIIQ